jgi:hypothetical protein
MATPTLGRFVATEVRDGLKLTEKKDVSPGGEV